MAKAKIKTYLFFSSKKFLTTKRFLAFAVVFLPFAFSRISLALPPPEDIPEEILRTEIIIEARSPKDGKPLTAGEYAELQLELTERKLPHEINPKLQQLIFLLRLRKLLNGLNPF